VARPALDYLILDAVADDVESVPNIRGRVVSTDPLSGTNLLESLRRLTNDRLVEACVLKGLELVGVGEGVWPPGTVEDMWFRITSRGTMVHGNWADEGAA
jgi:hypothetical protein